MDPAYMGTVVTENIGTPAPPDPVMVGLLAAVFSLPVNLAIGAAVGAVRRTGVLRGAVLGGVGGSLGLAVSMAAGVPFAGLAGAVGLPFVAGAKR